ncbi:gastrin-releasing peptide [Cololabis saira]|uniref:gastrin-releasing peptide n=1 Tax=Cololabis saira TaxID=129043 RepID=UPI002AD21A7D|nr:gastrin-releasing peptide [Cololabis saira]
MGGECLCFSWTCRPLWPVFAVLALIPCLLHCSTPAPVVGKMYPRGNHWAVGHLMGKKSIKSLAQLKETVDSGYLTPSEAVRVSDQDRQERPIKALQPKTQKQMIPQRLHQLHSSWREEDTAKYLREVSELFFLALELKENESS